MTLQEQTTSAIETVKEKNPEIVKAAGDICFVAGFASIAISIIAWGYKKGTDSEAKAERLGIFIGLWAPTFFILSHRFEKYAERLKEAQS